MQVSFLKKWNVNNPAGSVTAMDTSAPRRSGVRLLGARHVLLSDPRSAGETQPLSITESSSVALRVTVRAL